MSASPATPSKAEAFDVEVQKRTPKKKPAVQQRLENSPRKILSPEDIKSRQEKAQKIRDNYEQQRVTKVSQHVEHIKDIRRREKENSPVSSPVKGSQQQPATPVKAVQQPATPVKVVQQVETPVKAAQQQ